MCFHVSVNTYWAYYILHPCHRSGTRVNLGDLFSYYYDNILSAVVCMVITGERELSSIKTENTVNISDQLFYAPTITRG